MRAKTGAVGMVSLVAACMLAAQTQTPTSLADVHVIFVDSLGGSTSGLTQSNLINRLSASQKFQVTVDRDKADAVITGSVGGNGYAGLLGKVMFAVRLTTRDGRILWVLDGSGGSSSSVADKIVKELVKAASPKKK